MLEAIKMVPSTVSCSGSDKCYHLMIASGWTSDWGTNKHYVLRKEKYYFYSLFLLYIIGNIIVNSKESTDYYLWKL